MNGFLAELMRRNVVKVGIAYSVLAWLLMQVGSLFASAFAFPAIIMHVVIFFLMLGFPLAVLFAWAFELTPEGLKRSEEVERDVSVTKETGKRLNLLIIGVMGLVIVVLLVDRFVFVESETGEIASNGEVALGERSYDSIAVLPFVNMSDDKGQEFFSDGISEELLNLLAKTRGLRVAARTSSFAFKNKNQDITDIGEKLNVETVLEGSVRKADTKLRITAQLIDVESGYHLWSETYDRELTDVFAIQDEISAAIVGALSVHFGGEVQSAATSTTGNIRAYEEYLKGKELLLVRTKEAIEKAADHFDRAMEIDPKFAPAYVGKADSFLLLADSGGAYGDIPKKYAYEFAQPLIDIALELDPELADAYNSRAFILNDAEEFEQAMKDFDRALELRPNFSIALMWKSFLLTDMGEWQQAWETLEKAHQVDPLNLTIMYNLAQRRATKGDIQGVDELADKAEGIAPDRYDRFARMRAAARSVEGDYSEAWLLYGRVVEETGLDRLRLDLSYFDHLLKRFSAALKNAPPDYRIYLHLFQNDPGEAREVYRRMDPDWQGSDEGLWALVNIEMWTGNYVEANEILEASLSDVDMSPGGPLFRDGDDVHYRVAPYMRIKKELGQKEAFGVALASLEDFSQRCRDNGLHFICHRFETLALMFKGDEDGALIEMDKALQNFTFDWDARINPIFDTLAVRDDFQVLFDELDAHINKERAELGWPPADKAP